MWLLFAFYGGVSMDVLMFNPSVDFGYNPSKNSYVFFSGDKREFNRIKSNKYVDFIVENASNKISIKDFLNNGNMLGLEKQELKLHLAILCRKGITLIKDVEQNTEYAVTELSNNYRYGYQLLYLKERFKNNLEGMDDDEIQKVISSFSVVIIGAGSPGSLLAVMFAAIGVGNISIIDGDVVDESNLMRQFFYFERDIGNKKVTALKNYIKKFNSGVCVNAVSSYINEDNVYNLIPDADMIIQTADKPIGIIDRLVDKCSEKKKVPCLFMHNQSIGPLVIPGKTKSFRDFEVKYNEETNGMYFDEIEYQDKRSNPGYPTIVHGVIPLTTKVFDVVLSYMFKDDVSYLEDGIWFENGNMQRF
ncbi:hypothetical protein FC25_GL001171 [Ligilactobacillus ruminis DSM 20403 = NBRC 102161]|nr:hypothetical protein FC25_GL001171 [Ligilactobacillus ruminis DSM 20403 = NBRC 102161]